MKLNSSWKKERKKPQMKLVIKVNMCSTWCALKI